MLDISSKINDPNLIEVLKKVSVILDEENVDFMLAGAMARDWIFEKYYSSGPAPSATTDYDFTIKMSQKCDYGQLREKLFKCGFEDVDRKLKVGYSGILLDLVPFDEYETSDKQKNSLGFLVTGCREALENFIEIKLSDELVIKIVSIEGLVLLKLISWFDAYNARDNDAVDIRYILKNYKKVFEMENSLYDDEYFPIFERFDYEELPTVIYILGTKIREIASEEAIEFLRYLNNDDKFNTFCSHMRGNVDENAEMLKVLIDAIFPEITD